jgi:hypothetical protein
VRIIETFKTPRGLVQIQDHGTAFLVSYPADPAGSYREKKFTKIIGASTWNKAQAFAAEMCRAMRAPPAFNPFR